MLIRWPRRPLKKLRQVTKDGRNDIWFEDECHFQQHGTRCRMWIPPEEKDPVLLHAPTRKSIALFGAVRANTGQMVSMMTTIFNAETFLKFLKMVLKNRKRGKKLVLILDNARYHHATMIQPWLNRNKKWIKLIFLPPYSPDLNNIERVWKMTRQICTHNRYFSTLDELACVIKKQMKEWSAPNETLRKLCCIN
jgi:transposase